MARIVTVTATNPAGAIVAATARPTRGTAGHAVQTTSWIAIIEGTAVVALPNGNTVSTPPPTTITTCRTALPNARRTARPGTRLTARPGARLTARPDALLTALLAALLAATGPPTALVTAPLPDVATTPQTPTGTAPRRDPLAAMRSLFLTRQRTMTQSGPLNPTSFLMTAFCRSPRPWTVSTGNRRFHHCRGRFANMERTTC